MWLQMPELILGLQFEVELGNYFEEVMAWHNRTVPINTRSRFRLEEVFYLYFDFKVPWWNSAVTDPATVMPKTMKYLEALKEQGLDLPMQSHPMGTEQGSR
jgi:hypothetical protein